MRRLDRRIFAVVSLATTLLLTSCEWESGADNNFNTSGGSANVNISGVYRGANGDRIVSDTSNGNITSLTVQQSGNRVNVTDNQGSRYEGTIGAPLVSGLAPGGVLQTGATVASYQISFTGRDGVAARDIEFTGVITITLVRDVNGDDVVDTVTSTDTTETNSVLPPLAPDAGTGTETTNTDTTEVVTTTTRTLRLQQNNSQLQLNGTWVELGGVASNVQGNGPAAQGNVSFVFLDETDIVIFPVPPVPPATPDAGGGGGGEE